MNDSINIDDSVKDLVTGVKKDRLGTTVTEDVLARFIEGQPETIGTVAVSDLAKLQGSGMSSATFFFTAELDLGKGREKLDLVARLHPGRGIFHDYDFGAQFNIQKALRRAGVPVPNTLWLDTGGDYLGAPGFVMERVHGIGPDQAFFTTGLLAEASPADRNAMITDAISVLAKIHSVDLRVLDLDYLESRGHGNTAIARDINWHWNELQQAKPEAMAMLTPARSWLLENQPTLVRPVLCHGDSNLANFIFHDNCVVALLDWELSYLGAPECDLAYMSWTSKLVTIGRDLPPGAPTDQKFQEIYEHFSGHTISDWNYYYTLQIFRTRIHGELAFRDLPAELLAANKPFLDFLSNSLLEQIP